MVGEHSTLLAAKASRYASCLNYADEDDDEDSIVYPLMVKLLSTFTAPQCTRTYCIAVSADHMHRSNDSHDELVKGVSICSTEICSISIANRCKLK